MCSAKLGSMASSLTNQGWGGTNRATTWDDADLFDLVKSPLMRFLLPYRGRVLVIELRPLVYSYLDGLIEARDIHSHPSERHTDGRAIHEEPGPGLQTSAFPPKMSREYLCILSL